MPLMNTSLRWTHGRSIGFYDLLVDQDQPDRHDYLVYGEADGRTLGRVRWDQAIGAFRYIHYGNELRIDQLEDIATFCKRVTTQALGNG
jgi:hypothetical protein